jgi:hypothetical protein
VIEVHKVLLVRKALKGLLEVKAKLAPPEFLATKVQQDNLVRWATKEILVKKD